MRRSTFIRLERIRQAEKQNLIFYFQNLERQAREIDGGTWMLEYFFQFTQGNVALERLDTELEIYYLVNYSDFYDILFVDTSGYIFHPTSGNPTTIHI